MISKSNYLEKLNRLINDFNDIKKKNINNNDLSDYIFNNIINDINNLNIIILDEINNSKNMNEFNSEISKMKLDLENLIINQEYLLIDSFDQKNINKDQAYNKFKKKEEIILIDSFLRIKYL